MNGANLDENIAVATSEVTDTYRSNLRPKEKEDNGDDARLPTTSRSNADVQSPAHARPRQDPKDLSYVMPTKWWYASTGFPLLTGTFGPMANAFSICALVENWRENLLPGTTESTAVNIPDPRWLVAINAVSLVFALIANASLLLNMARRLDFSIAQPITIIGFWVSSVLLIALIAVASYDFRAPGVQSQALTQAYYYACWAAGIYQIISYLMCVTVYGAMKKKYDSEFNLTMAQRTLMLQTISYFTYLLLGALVFSKIEGWRFLDAVYWADFTLLTVGIGDYAPATHLGRGLLFPFAIGGIVILGLVVSSIRSLVLDRGKKKMSARMTENIRRKVVRQVEIIRDKESTTRRRKVGLDKDVIKKLSAGPQENPEEELERRQAEFQAMRRVQAMSDHRQKWVNLGVSTSAFAVLWFVGALVFWRTEIKEQQWTYFASMYFSYTSLLTIGYGDLSPVSNSGKPFFVFWSLLAVPSLTILISDMGDTIVKSIKELTIWLGEISILPSDEGSVLERLEYGLYKATAGNWQRNSTWKDDSSQSSDATTEDGRHIPFMARIFRVIDKSKNKKQEMNTDRLARDFENVEKVDENEARLRGDKLQVDEHHYRHLLVSQIRRVYADSNLATPKHYSYKEWVFFLKLLGEDESSGALHRSAEVKNPHNQAHTNTDEGSKSHTPNSSRPDSAEQEDVTRWSWMGPRSPLMSDKSEPDLLLEFLFQRLEESLGGIDKYKEKQITQESREEHDKEDEAQ